MAPVTDETEAQVREERERAVEYGERVLRGEEPWKDEQAGDNVEDDSPVNADVGEVGEPGGEVSEVDQDYPAPEPEE